MQLDTSTIVQTLFVDTVPPGRESVRNGCDFGGYADNRAVRPGTLGGAEIEMDLASVLDPANCDRPYNDTV